MTLLSDLSNLFGREPATATPIPPPGADRLGAMTLPVMPAGESGASEHVGLVLRAAQNWVCDGCRHAWWEADAYQCPACGQSAMHRWGEHDDER